MPITKEKTVTVKYFDESWAPRGTFIKFDVKNPDEITTVYGWVYDYSDDCTTMFVNTIDGRQGTIRMEHIHRYTIHRLIPESDDTLDMDYESLMIEHERSN